MLSVTAIRKARVHIPRLLRAVRERENGLSRPLITVISKTERAARALHAEGRVGARNVVVERDLTAGRIKGGTKYSGNERRVLITKTAE